MANKETFRTLFEKDYTNFDAILQNLVKPVFGEKIRTHNKSVAVEKQDESLIKNITVFASLGGAFPINFIDVTIKSKTRIHQNRVTIQNCVRRIMENLDSALIFFHYEDFENRPWRISFVNKGETAKEATNPKRYTYLCGVGCSCRTAVERFEILKNEIQSGQKNLKDLMVNAFSVESVSNEFFEEYREHYADFVEYLSGNRYVKKGGAFVQEKTGKASKYYKETFGCDDKAVRDYVKKLMGRLVFLQFLQKKGWMGVVEENKWNGGDKNFTNNLFKAASAEQKKNFLEDVLKPIFFKCLNKDRKDKGDKFDTGVSSIGKKGVVRIPYLNGGLFKSETEDETVIKFPEELFENLFDFFSRYNFTIDESDPLDVEVGVDPEMLGKIFENLLEDNKDKGAFYTPKEIVNYMCKESLTAYLIENGELKIENCENAPSTFSVSTNLRQQVLRHNGELKIDNEKIRAFVNNPCSETASSFTQKQLSILNYQLSIIKICDPAVGSGAFPMGLLNLLFNCRIALGDKTPHSDLKKQIVQNNIYGVDIEKGAVDIARLRFWLAIVVDAEKPEPLPNLDYKIMQGNSLIESYKGIDLSVLTKQRKENDGKTSDIGTMTKSDEEYQNDLIAYGDDGKVADHIGELVKLLNEYYLPNNSDIKDKLKSSINKMVQMILEDNMNDRKILAELAKMDLEATSEFFLWHLWFGDVFNRPAESGGFDIVIGNPPYVFARNSKEKGMTKEQKKIYYDNFELAKYQINLYHLFIERGTKLLKSNGTFAYIVPNNWMTINTNKALREYVLKKSNVQIVNFYKKVFENADVDSSIIIYSNSNKNNSLILGESETKEKIVKVYTGKTSDFLSKKDFIINIDLLKGGDNIALILDKIENASKELKEVADVKAGLKAYEVGAGTPPQTEEMKKNRVYHSLNKNGNNWFPYIRGIDVKRYELTWESKEYIKWGKNLAAPRSDFSLYSSPRILVRQIPSKPPYCVNACFSDEIYVNDLNSMNVINIQCDPKFVLGILNSRAVSFWFEHKFGKLQRGLFPQFKINELAIFPIPQATPEHQQEIILLVDKILSTKKSNPNAETSELERKIDEIVYELYGLSKPEIDIVEGK